MSNREFFAQLCSSEFPRFVGVLKAAPDGRLDYTPHPKSRTAYQLIAHMLGHEADLVELAQTGSINHRLEVPFKSVEEAVATYTKTHEELMPKLQALDDADWECVGQFTVQGHVVIEAPRSQLAWMMLLDAVHHRGQLSTYLRPMGAAVPSIYGPSADTMTAQV